MRSFLEDLAEGTLKRHSSLDGLTFVFPNRRAVLYFRKHLSALLTKPSFAPGIITIEEFVSGLSTLQVPDRLELVHRLYMVYNQVMSNRQDGEEVIREPFDQFYFWGDMLLRDFDELDKYKVNARQLFKDLSNQKELDSSYDYLTEDQLEYLRSFWGNFSHDLNANKRKFLRVWRLLPDVYDAYHEHLRSLGLAYDGMLYRQVADDLLSGTVKQHANSRLIFAGYNALTGTEEEIISHFVTTANAEVHWDVDTYYVNNNAQEGGRFFRQYQESKALGATFPKDIPSNFMAAKAVRIIGSAQHVGQAKLMSQILAEQLKKGINPEDTLIVLPDEKLLLPVLHGVAGHVDKLNVTMGFPLASTPMFNLIEFLVELQQHQRGDYFNHRQVLALLSHPYVVSADPSHAYRTRKAIQEKNQVSVPGKFLNTGPMLYIVMFKALEGNSVLHYLRDVVREIGALETLTPLDKEYAFHALTLINRLDEVMGQSFDAAQDQKDGLKSFMRLFRQLGKSQKIPFTGEPLKGLQVMGVLETRNLDFKNVFVLSLNEGALPSSGNKASYIPYNIRKAYSMPTAEHQDAMYAYLFYRVLQRAENVFLFYNTEPDILGQGEMSRFLQQIMVESGWKVKPEILHSPIHPRPITPISVAKDERVLEGLTKLNEGTSRSKGISPSALNAYIDCPLQFYLKHVAKIREPDEVEDFVDARLFGNLLHEVMEQFYRRIQEKKKTNIIQSTDFDHYKETIGQLMDNAFNNQFGLEQSNKITYQGQRLVVREVIRSFVEKIIEHDMASTPFSIEGLERGELLYYVPISHAPGQAVLSGKIDRLDRKGDVIRILDYKTGKGDLDFVSIESLFDGTKKRNKAAFQTLIYTLLYKANHPVEGLKLAPGLISRQNLFEDVLRTQLILVKVEVADASELLGEFEVKLKALLEEIFNPAVSFQQTENTDTCTYCAFKNICYR